MSQIETIRGVIARETRRQRSYLWGKFRVFEPRLVKQKFGDGKQLIYYGTIDMRPYYWLIRIDSKTDTGDGEWDWEQIAQAIENQFGEVEDGPCKYPMIKNTMGCYWDTITTFR